MSVSETATCGLYRVVRASAAQQRLHDLLRNRRRDSTTEAVQLLLEDDGDRDLRVLSRSERDEPGRVDVRDARLRGAGLARDGNAGDLRRRAGAALHDELHHLVELRGRLRLDRAAQRRGLRR